jgi:hypothetical protein
MEWFYGKLAHADTTAGVTCDYKSEDGFSDGKAEFGFTSASVSAVLKRQSAAVGFGNLAAEDQSDA